MKYSTCFGHVHCPSSGVSQQCIPAIGICHSSSVGVCTHDVAGRWLATSWVLYTTSCNTQSSAPEDGQNNCPKPVELTGIDNKPLLLHLVGCLYYLYFIIFFKTC